MEQSALDEHDNKVADLAVCLQQLASETSATPLSSVSELDPHRCLHKRLGRLENDLQLVASGVESISSDSEVDTYLLRQYEEQLSGIKTELMSISHDILALDHEQDTKLNQAVFDVRLRIKRLLRGEAKPAPCSAEEGGVKLLKLDVSTFDGNIVNWRSFWEQFSISVHDRRKLSDSETLTYLRHGLKDGATKHMVKGLSGSGVH